MSKAVVLVLAYHMDAIEMGYFSKEEFVGGLEKLGLGLYLLLTV